MPKQTIHVVYSVVESNSHFFLSCPRYDLVCMKYPTIHISYLKSFFSIDIVFNDGNTNIFKAIQIHKTNERT